MLCIPRALVPAVVVALALAGCGSADDPDTLLVLAASSLTDSFDAMETAFEAVNPDVDVEISVAGSSALSVQIEQGAPADVVALADTAPMDALAAAGLVERSIPFAANTMVLAVPIDNPGDVDGLDALSDSGLLIGVCAPQVPCGRYAREVLDAAGVDASLDTEEPDVRSLAGKIASGELDAGLVYATDVGSMPDRLVAIPLPDGVDVRAEYPIAVVSATDARDRARRFIDFVNSAAGQAILADAGFGAI
jgi:molybdate transport system substrate-binding protein